MAAKSLGESDPANSALAGRSHPRPGNHSNPVAKAKKENRAGNLADEVGGRISYSCLPHSWIGFTVLTV